MAPRLQDSLSPEYHSYLFGKAYPVSRKLENGYYVLVPVDEKYITYKYEYYPDKACWQLDEMKRRLGQSSNLAQ